MDSWSTANAGVRLPYSFWPKSRRYVENMAEATRNSYQKAGAINVFSPNCVYHTIILGEFFLLNYVNC